MSANIIFFGIGMPEWIVIIGVILLLFGGKKIPELMRGIGGGIREFNDAKKSVKDQIEEGMKEPRSTDSKSEVKKDNTEQ
mgnify:CR=1 FL=1